MALLDPARSDTPTATARVAALVIIHEGSSLRDSLEAVERQVYETEAVFVVGGGTTGPAEVAASRWVPTVADGMAALDSEITHVWLLHDDSIPRPDTLGALVREGSRVEADLVGSKVLAAGHPGILESVGLATDVFEVPASGLDGGELDQEQYDVLRDVAFVAGSSILVDRDMLDRVGGPDPLLEPITGALDLCQRVRLAGGRVVVVPSAEVLHDGTCARESKHWRVEAGRLRAMLKAYSPITLLWVVPFNFVLDLLGAAVNLLRGRFRLLAFVQAWGWNLLRLPNTMAARRRVERVAGDAELFRFQIRGSARLTRFGQRFADALVRVTASERTRSLVETGGETVRRPVVASLLTGVGYGLFATRQLWFDGVASAGYALAPASSAASALNAYAGGWNPAGLGSAEPLRPVLGAVSLVQVALLGRASLTLVVLLVIAAVGGVVGVARLLGPFGIRPAARYAAGVLFIGGPAVRVMAGTGVWHGIVAMAILPWIVSVVLHRRRAAAAMVAAALLTAIAAAFAPLMLVLPTLLVLVWALVEPVGAAGRVGRAAVGAALAVPVLFPWVGALDDVAFFFTAGADFYWAPSPWVVGLVAVGTLSLLAAAPPALSRLSGWGALVMTGGALLARSGGFGWGTDPGAAGMAAVGLGMAAVVGAGFEAGARAFEAQGLSRYLRVVATLASALLLVGVSTLAVPGRLGFPSTGLTETLAFTAEAHPGRAMLIGDEATMPDGGRELPGGIHYRVVSTPVPRMWEAWSTPELAGDTALSDSLTSALSGSSFRLGEDLAAFGIGWIVTTGSPQVINALDAQLDLFPLVLADTRAYQVEVPAPRAIDAAGNAWIATGSTYVGPAGGGTVRLAENADTRWGDSALAWSQDGWANQVTTVSSVIEFGPIGRLRLAALAALIWAGVLVLGVAAVREKEPQV